MRPALLVLARLPEEELDRLRPVFDLHVITRDDDPVEKITEVAPRVQAVASAVWGQVTGRLIRALPNLEIIANYGVGYDNIDMAAARERGIVVTNTPDVLTDDVADVALALTLGVLRRVVEGDLYVRTGQWGKKGSMPLGRSLRGKTMGIVGLGRIGKALALRAEACGMKVVWHGPAKSKPTPWPHYADLCNMAEVSDVLAVTCRYDESTHHLIDARVLKSLGRGGVLINVARGKIVDEAALIDALEGGVIAGAGLDVFESEPDVPSALCRMDNVVLQPHVGSATAETRGAMARLVVDNLIAYFERGEVLTPV